MIDNIDVHFPIKIDGKPSYRPHQKETIIRILNTFKNKKFVAVDGPVGCGKSAINYTVAKIIGETAYLTSQKQLQDQIARERWSDVKMIKGKNAYTCTYLLKKGHANISCDYNKQELSMCNNNDTLVSPDVFTRDKLISSIKETVGELKNNENVLRKRTAFEPGESIEQVFAMIEDKFDEDPVKLIACRLNPNIECPMKSTKVVGKIYPIRIFNPDVFYLINQNSEGYKSNSLMIIDECHTLESVIKRIFEVNIPVDSIKHVLNINFEPLMKSKTIKEFSNKFSKMYNDYIAPMMCLSSIICNIGSEIMTGDNLNTSLKSDLAIAFKNDNMFSEFTEINMFEVVDGIVSGKDNPKFRQLTKAIRQKLADNMGAYGIKYFNLSLMDYFKHGWTKKRVFHNFKILEDILSPVVVASKELISIKNGELDSFIFQEQYLHTKVALGKIKNFYEVMKDHVDVEKKERVLNILPAAIGPLLHKYFYSTSEKILFSTGTWIDYKNVIRLMGVSESECEYIRIPTTFDKKRRPIYVAENLTDFSEKNEEGYIYKTEYGIKKFNMELSDLITKLRVFIQKRHKKNANILIHSHTNELSKMIAENCPIIDDTFLIHYGDKGIITNIHTGVETIPKDKDKLLDRFMHSPDSGLVLISPSISEGVDFKGDIARAQIILKRPIPNIKDKYIECYMNGNAELGIEKNFNYLRRLIYITLLQQYGRIMRSVDDWGYTIFFDRTLCSDMIKLLTRKGDINFFNMDYLVQGIQGGMSRGIPWFDQNIFKGEK